MQDYRISQLAYGHAQQEHEIEALRKQIATANDTIEKLKKENAERISTDILFEIKKENIEMPPEFANVTKFIFSMYYDGILLYCFKDSTNKYKIYLFNGTNHILINSSNSYIQILFVYKTDSKSDDICLILSKTNDIIKYNKSTKTLSEPPYESLPLYQYNVIFIRDNYIPYKNKIVLYTSKNNNHKYVPAYFDLDDKRLKPLTDFPYYNKYIADKGVYYTNTRNKRDESYNILFKTNNGWYTCTIKDIIDDIGEPIKLDIPPNYDAVYRSEGIVYYKKTNDITYAEIRDSNYKNLVKKFTFPTSNSPCGWYIFAKNYIVFNNFINNINDNESIAVNIDNNMFNFEYQCNDINATEFPMLRITEPGKADYVIFKPSNKACMLDGKIVTKCII